MTDAATEQPANNVTSFTVEDSEEEHEFDARTAFLINVTLIGCLLLAYYVKRFRIYSLPESAGALLVGVVVGGIARLCTDNLVLFEFVSLNRLQIPRAFSHHNHRNRNSSSSYYFLQLSSRQGIL